MKEIYNSSTKFYLFLMIISLIGMNVFAIIFFPDTVFEKVFTVFSTITNNLVGYFIAKSTQDGKSNTVTTTVSKEIPVDKPIDEKTQDVTASVIDIDSK